MNAAISKKGIVILLAVALLLRVGYWSFLKQPKDSADTPKYLYCAKMLACGDAKEIFAKWPLYQLYPLFLSPMYIFSIPGAPYIASLHIILSLLTVFLLYWAGRLLMSHRYGLWVGALAAFYPSFIFWLPYILTETAFLFFLSLFIVAFLILLKKRSFLHWVNYLTACVLVLIARPASLPILLVSGIVVSMLVVSRTFDITLASAFLKIAIVLSIALTALTVLLASHTEVSSILLRDHIFVQLFYRSAKISTNNIDEQKVVWNEEERLAGKISEPELSDYKVKEAAGFISAHPFLYLKMSLKRFIAFWYPWIFAVRWSRFHLMLDFFISCFLTLCALAALFGKSEHGKLPIISLILMAFSLAFLSAFSLVDTDVRYRLPAELILLVVAPYGLQILLYKARILKTFLFAVNNYSFMAKK